MNRTLVLFLATTALSFAQPPTGGWRRVTDPPPHPAQQGTDPEPVGQSDAYGQPAGQQPPANRPAYDLPSQVTIRPGTYLTVRLNQVLSSDRNAPGDTYVGSLAQPLVVDGIVLGHRNQLVYGRVVDAERARAGAPSRLGLDLRSITLADGNQLPIRSQMVVNRGGTMPADAQVATIGATTATGAAIGAIAGWGTGAAIGAGVGAMAGLAGVVLTKNRPTILYPEEVLTFAIVEPATVSTHNAQAFRFVGPDDYEQPITQTRLQPRPTVVQAPYPYPVYAPYPYPYPYAYPYPYYGVSVVVGRGWGWGPYWGGPRYRRRW